MAVMLEGKVSFIFEPVASCIFAFFLRLNRNLFGVEVEFPPSAADLAAFFL